MVIELRMCIDKIKAIRGLSNRQRTIDNIQRFGSVIELIPELEQQYRELHANVWSPILKRLSQSNIQNYSIFIAELEKKKFLFSYFEYSGTDWEKDQQMISDDPNTQKWWAETDPCQKRLPNSKEGEQWLDLESVFFMS